MIKRLLGIFFIMNLMSLSSCWNCDDYEYYDFEGINIVVSNPFVAVNDSLLMAVHSSNTTFMAKEKVLKHGGLLYAITCDKGYGGPKYPLTSISIKSNADFSDNYPANSELNTLFMVRGDNENNEYVMDYLNEFHPAEVNIGYIYLSVKPELSNVHQFTIEIIKSNGEILSATSEPVTFE